MNRFRYLILLGRQPARPSICKLIKLNLRKLHNCSEIDAAVDDDNDDNDDDNDEEMDCCKEFKA